MKTFIIKNLFYFIPFCCIWIAYNILNKGHSHITGDLGKLGQIPFGTEYVQYLNQNYLSDNLVIDTTIVAYKKLQIPNSSKILTIGDSFSQQGIFGYQNYLAHILGFKITNIKIDFRTGLQLLNSKVIDSSNCKIIILEQVDRHAIQNLCNINFDVKYKLPKKKNNTQKKDNEDTDIDSNLYYLCWWTRLQLGYDNPVLKCNLKQDYFTHNRFSHKLFYYQEDMLFEKTSKADIEKAKKNLILLNKKFSEKGIKMIFLIASDKYDVYRPFMTDNSLPVDTTTDELSNIPNVCIINTKPILQNIVKNGEKDVYMVNDTHWSYKASKVVAQRLAQVIDFL